MSGKSVPPSDPAVQSVSRSRPLRGRSDTRGEALPVAILFLGVMFTILMGVHVIVVAMARTTVQAAADAAVNAAQNAASGSRVSEGVLAAQITLAVSSSAVETRTPAVVVEAERGQVQALVFAGTISPIFGGVEFSALACGPLDDITTSALSSAEAWQC